MRAVTGAKNLHSAHQLFPRVPFYHYRALHRDIEPIIRLQGTPILSRKPLDPKVSR